MTNVRIIRSQAPSRPAYLLVAVLVCLALVMTLGSLWLRTISLERSHIRADLRGVQAEFLAASALSRAAARLAGNADYAGESWQLDCESLGGSSDARVTIAVAAVPDQPDQRKISVVAEVPATGKARARRSRESVYQLPRRDTRQELAP